MYGANGNFLAVEVGKKTLTHMNPSFFQTQDTPTSISTKQGHIKSISRSMSENLRKNLSRMPKQVPQKFCQLIEEENKQIQQENMNNKYIIDFITDELIKTENTNQRWKNLARVNTHQALMSSSDQSLDTG